MLSKRLLGGEQASLRCCKLHVLNRGRRLPLPTQTPPAQARHDQARQGLTAVGPSPPVPAQRGRVELILARLGLVAAETTARPADAAARGGG